MQKKTSKKSNNNFIAVKNIVKNKLMLLPDYTLNEEVFLIEESTGLKKEKLYLQKALTSKQTKKIQHTLKQRVKGKPLNKIFKKSYFYGLEFFVNNHVLAPRKETEILVELAIQKSKEIKKEDIKVLDLCCGSGVIGLTIAKCSSKKTNIFLSDVSGKALRVCKKNAKKLGLQKNVKIVKSNLFCGLKNLGPFDIIVCNPPYVPTKDIQKLDVSVKKYDPILALDGKEDGLYFYKKIAQKARDFLTKNGVFLLEFGIKQAKNVKKILEKNGFFVKIFNDYSNIQRVALATIQGE